MITRSLKAIIVIFSSNLNTHTNKHIAELCPLTNQQARPDFAETVWSTEGETEMRGGGRPRIIIICQLPCKGKHGLPRAGGLNSGFVLLLTISSQR